MDSLITTSGLTSSRQLIDKTDSDIFIYNESTAAEREEELDTSPSPKHEKATLTTCSTTEKVAV